jgi:hypothetical protein
MKVNFLKENGMVEVKFYFPMPPFNKVYGYKTKNNDIKYFYLNKAIFYEYQKSSNKRFLK